MMVTSKKCLLLLVAVLVVSTGLFAVKVWDAPASRRQIPQAAPRMFEPARADSAHGFDVQKYVITLNINDSTRFIQGDVLATVLAEELLSSITYELSTLSVSSVLVNGQAASFTHNGGLLNIAVDVAAGQTFTTQVFYSGVPTLSPNLYQIGMIFGSNSVFTISDPDAGRYWWPSYDHPWDKAVVDLHITMRSDWKVAANGLRSNIVNNGNGTSTTTWLGSNPMTTYLVCLTAGPYVEINQTVPDMNNLPIQNFVMQSQYNNAMVDFQRVPEMISYFSQLFGPYPFEKYGHATVNMSTFAAMEHQTMTTLGNSLITGNGTHEVTIAHELAHQWYGNGVSFLDFKDVWLSEGFATYSEHLWTDKRFGWESAVAYINSSYHQYYNSWEASIGPQTIYNPSFYNYFSPPSYEKSASVLHMLRLKIGDANFFQLLRQWFTTYNGGNAVTAEFEAMAEQISGMDLTQFFNQWIYGSGIPSVEYSVWQAEDISRVKIVAKSTSPSNTQFFLEVPFGISCGAVSDSLLAYASPNGQATEFLFGQPLVDCIISPNLNNWTMLRQITEDKPHLAECIPSHQSVLLSWDVFSPGVDTGYMVYRRMQSYLPWEALTEEPISATSFVDTTPWNNITYQYAIRVVASGGYLSALSNIATAMPMPFTFDYDLLLVDETRDGNGSAISPSDAQVDGFYYSAVEPIQPDFWDCTTQGLPLLGTLGMYKAVLWYADDFSQNLLLNNLQLISGYIQGGGKLLLSSWKTASVFNDAFVQRFMGNVSMNYDNTASLVGVYSDTYPNLFVDPNKTTPSWNNMLPQIYTFNDAANSIYTASMSAGAAGENKCVGLVHNSNGTFVMLGFPLYYMQFDGVRTFLQQLLPQLINGTEIADEVVAPIPAAISCSPNPFNPHTTIHYTNPQNGMVSISLYNLKGQRVRTLMSQSLNAGAHSLVFDGLSDQQQSLSTGIYLLKFSYPNGSITRKITLMK
jgi:hypothetical protein